MLVCNHLSYLDPVYTRCSSDRARRTPRFLAKDSLWRGPVFGRVIAGARQIPVSRGSRDAGASIAAARRALRRRRRRRHLPRGHDHAGPRRWPMEARSGAARLALASDVPVVPTVHWGTLAIYDHYRKRVRPSPFGTTVTVRAGAPIDLSDLRARVGEKGPGAALLRETTARMMTAVRELLEEVRGESAPQEGVGVRRPGDAGTGAMTRYAVLGAGSWGTTFAKVLADAGTDVTLWARRQEVADAIEKDHVNAEYLPESPCPRRCGPPRDAEAALDGVDAVVLALPRPEAARNLEDWRAHLPPRRHRGQPRQGRRDGHAQADERGRRRRRRGASPAGSRWSAGPNLARRDRRRAAHGHRRRLLGPRARRRGAARLRDTGYFKPYTNVDVIGCELGGACKNVIALACGMASGLGYGDNTTASLITRGLAEIARLTVALGGQTRHPRRPGRDGRPRRDLLLTALAQPPLRLPRWGPGCRSPRPRRPTTARSPRGSSRARRSGSWRAATRSTRRS